MNTYVYILLFREMYLTFYYNSYFVFKYSELYRWTFTGSQSYVATYILFFRVLFTEIDIHSGDIFVTI